MDYFNQHSERLTFRKLSEADIPAWTEFFINNDRLEYLGIDTNKSPEELAHQWIKQQLERYDSCGLGHLAIELKKTNTFIGVAGIIPRDLNGKEEYEIAYSLISRYWKKGYGTEAATQMRSYGLQSIKTDRLISIIHKANKDSVNVALKNGMHILFETEYLGMQVDVYGAHRVEI